MPDYYYQYNFQTDEFKREIQNQIPQTDTVGEISTVFSTVLKINVPATSKEDLDGFMSTKGAAEIPPTEEPTDQIAIAQMSRNLIDGQISQIITSTPQKTNFLVTNNRSTAGVITSDADNNQFTIDSIFNVNTGDNYSIRGVIAVRIPPRDFCVFELVHDDNGVLKMAGEIPAYGVTSSNGPLIIPIMGTFLVDNNVNQSFYIRVYTIGGNETINYYSSSLILERL